MEHQENIYGLIMAEKVLTFVINVGDKLIHKKYTTHIRREITKKQSNIVTNTTRIAAQDL